MGWSFRAKTALPLAAAIVAGSFAACGSSSSGGGGPGGADAADESDVTTADADTDVQGGDDAASLDDLPSLSDVPPFPVGPDGCYLAFGPCNVSTNCCSGNCTDAGCNPNPRPP